MSDDEAKEPPADPPKIPEMKPDTTLVADEIRASRFDDDSLKFSRAKRVERPKE